MKRHRLDGAPDGDIDRGPAAARNMGDPSRGPKRTCLSIELTTSESRDVYPLLTRHSIPHELCGVVIEYTRDPIGTLVKAHDLAVLLPDEKGRVVRLVSLTDGLFALHGGWLLRYSDVTNALELVTGDEEKRPKIIRLLSKHVGKFGATGVAEVCRMHTSHTAVVGCIGETLTTCRSDQEPVTLSHQVLSGGYPHPESELRFHCRFPKRGGAYLSVSNREGLVAERQTVNTSGVHTCFRLSAHAFVAWHGDGTVSVLDSSGTLSQRFPETPADAKALFDSKTCGWQHRYRHTAVWMDHLGERLYVFGIASDTHYRVRVHPVQPPFGRCSRPASIEQCVYGDWQFQWRELEDKSWRLLQFSLLGAADIVPASTTAAPNTTAPASASASSDDAWMPEPPSLRDKSLTQGERKQKARDLSASLSSAISRSSSP